MQFPRNPPWGLKIQGKRHDGYCTRSPFPAGWYVDDREFFVVVGIAPMAKALYTNQDFSRVEKWSIRSGAVPEPWLAPTSGTVPVFTHN
jgi:hypothetical protein